MAAAVSNDTDLDTPIASFEDLFFPFREAEKPREEFRVGAEMEKFGVFADGSPIPYDGAHGVGEILRELADEAGWTPYRESDDGPLIALTKGGASVTLEPGSQLELSGAPLVHSHQICAEFHAHFVEITPFSQRNGITWLGLGFHPFARRDQFTMVPKQRYAIMREYLPTRGNLALDMMLRTSTVQANFDYESEADAMRKLRVALKLSPLTTALFANSPFYEGKPFGGKSYRAKVWLDVDPDRSGLLPSMWAADASYETYIRWVLSAPMFMIKRDGKPVKNTGQTFESFLKDGFEGHRPTRSDWQTHVNTMFPEVRLKRTIEIRGADAQGSPMACALPALWTGLLYDDEALSKIEALTEDWTFDEVSGTREQIWQKGLGATFRDGTLVPLAEALLDIAKGGLERRHFLAPSGKDERKHLWRLEKLVSRGMTPADQLLEGLENADDLTQAIIERTKLES